MSVYRGEVDVLDACSSGRISKAPSAYEGSVPNPARAAIYANEYMGTRFTKGDSVRWVYVDGVPDGNAATPVVAVQNQEAEPLDIEGYDIAWSTLVEKWIGAKLKSVYKNMDWDLDAVTARRVPVKMW